jgi:hypothetical protein
MIIENLIWTLPVLLAALLGSIITRNHKEKERFNEAASIFRNKILTELIGFYPIVNLWNKNEFPRLYQSIPKINSAAAEFRYFVTCKADFDEAMNEYNQYCRDNTADKIFCLDFYQNMPGTKNRNDYIEQFKNIVEHMISFTNEK